MKKMTIKDLYIYAMENDMEDLELLVLDEEGRLSYVKESALKEVPAHPGCIMLDPQ